MKYKVGDKVRIKTNLSAYESDKCYVVKSMIDMEGQEHIIEEVGIINHNYKIFQNDGEYYWWFSEEMLEPVAPTLAEIKEKKLTCVVHAKTKREADMLFKAVDSYDHNGKTWASWWDVYKEKTCYRTDLGEVVAYGCMDDYIENGEKVIEFSDLVTTGGYCNGFRGDKKPEYSDNIMATAESISHITVIPYENSINKLKTCLGAFSNDGISAKNGGKNSMKFTFYVTDWVDINKTNGEKIPMKRTVAYIGSNTDVKADTSCPVAEYDERIGCLIAAAKISAKKSNEAKMMYNIARNTWGTELSWAILFELADSAFNGNFERAYKKFHNDNLRFEKKRLTCSFCGKVFETIEEKTKHENEHIQNKKNKREKYLIRKEAKRRLAEAEREGKIEQTMKELYKK